ncbi:HK97 gp10 family phage protein [Sporolactobacillus shoreicorticis]|uniref:HK97-gp10 family putative phage morphogenesis protein n=1 Tax=Sporolactobacillus shoreicorticis TaxID=1923877 RepID=A0ABW5S9X5_9BACL|nr:HK97-gp10 family putative phage morphogenesis protein [Sporolactobacillus shoreicorticis]MCO7126637.1 HK97 gp10 family phage protein [Sporolactobacillus shoreicorticis]
MSNVEITGLDDIVNNLDQLIISEVAKQNAINAAANVYAEALEQVKFKHDGEKGTHLKDHVTFKKDQYDDHSTDVGYDKKGFYYRFVNNGTKYQPGQHFMEHVFDQQQEAMKQAMFDELKKDVDHHA